MATFILTNSGPVFVTDTNGTVSLVPGLPIAPLDVPAQALVAGLVTDADAFYAPSVGTVSALVLQPALVPDDSAIQAPTLAAGAVALLPALVPVDDAVPAATLIRGTVSLLPQLVADADTITPAGIVSAAGILLPQLVAADDAINSPTVVAGSTALLPGRPIDAETFFAPRAGQDRFLRPALVPSDDFFWPPYNVDTVKLPHEQKLRAPLVPAPDTIYPPFFPRTPLLYVDQDAIYAVITQAEYPLRPALLPNDDSIKSPFIAMVARPVLVPSDDAIRSPGITLFLVPKLLASDDAIPAADVGWQVIAGFTTDNDAGYGFDAFAYYEMFPEVWFDEETIDTYPFFVQSVTGGIPIPKPKGILTGSISQPRKLTGSLGSRTRLTGSITQPRRLTGSFRK